MVSNRGCIESIRRRSPSSFASFAPLRETFFIGDCSMYPRRHSSRLFIHTHRGAKKFSRKGAKLAKVDSLLITNLGAHVSKRGCIESIRRRSPSSFASFAPLRETFFTGDCTMHPGGSRRDTYPHAPWSEEVFTQRREARAKVESLLITNLGAMVSERGCIEFIRRRRSFFLCELCAFA